MNIPELLSDLTIHYNALFRQLSVQLGLTTSQAFNLISIPNDGISMSRLSYRLGLDSSTLTRNIQKLEGMGFIIRLRGSYDKRVQNVCLTKLGHLMVEKIEEKQLLINASIMEHIDLDGQENISNVLERLVWAMDCAREQL